MRYNSLATPKTLTQKLYEIDWSLPVFLLFIAGCGTAMLYSVADGAWTPWALRHAIRFGAGFGIMLILALVPLRFFFALSYPFYLGVLLLLFGVEFAGTTAKGAQRWLELGPLRLQPSEFMKLAVVLALARYYHDIGSVRVSSPVKLLIPLLIIGVPFVLVLHQPDLGTAILLAATGLSLVFLAGLSWRLILPGCGVGALAVTLLLLFGLKDYQKERVLTFLNPERDALGAGYHIQQSKIALGSGGVTGKGFLQGTQSHLDFLPEKQTDFIFTMLGEEFGLVGALVLLALYAGVMVTCLNIALSCRHAFGRFVTMGVLVTFAFYVFVNAAMVSGLAPVVGVPMPLVSYGGTVMMMVMIGFGLILSVRVHRYAELPRGSGLF